MTSSQNSVIPEFGEGVLRGINYKKCSLLSQSINNPKLYRVSKNQLPLSVGSGDMRFFPLFFLALKKDHSSPALPPNWARELEFGM